MMIENKINSPSEYQEFMGIDPRVYDIPRSCFVKLKSRLFPNPWRVFGKVAFLHLVFGLLSLLVCNQFGLNPFNTTFSLSNWFIEIGGDMFCMSLCGMLFMGSTYIFSNFFLTLEEFESVKRHKWLQTGVLGLVSLASFYFFGAHLVVAVTLLWLSGVLMGGLLSVELSCYLRQRLQI